MSLQATSALRSARGVCRSLVPQSRTVWTGPRRETACRLVGLGDTAEGEVRVHLLTDEAVKEAGLPDALQADLRKKQAATMYGVNRELYIGLGAEAKLTHAGYRKAAVQAISSLRAAKCDAAEIRVGSMSSATLGVSGDSRASAIELSGERI